MYCTHVQFESADYKHNGDYLVDHAEKSLRISVKHTHALVVRGSELTNYHEMSTTVQHNNVCIMNTKYRIEGHFRWVSFQAL